MTSAFIMNKICYYPDKRLKSPIKEFEILPLRATKKSNLFF
jgi:hypothetical protein